MTATVGSLCSEYGGLELALAQVMDATPVWFADPDPGASKVLAWRFPEVPNFGDLASHDWSAVERPDILTAGWPCQDVSVAGRRAGLRAGTRTGLWHHIAAVGAPHRRERVFILAAHPERIAGRWPGPAVAPAGGATARFWPPQPRGRGSGATGGALVVGEGWGRYRPAIERWERTLGRPSPAPTLLSKRGARQLAPVWVEWLMGLPEGWVTAVPGLTRRQMLRLLGNGVVPQQASAAIRQLLPSLLAVREEVAA